uniref:Uncharacterized protein n=1 Tax=Setaria italica TaxID=4555 RepID=K3ZQ57_SETIT
MEENGWSLPAAISRMVGKLRFYLGNSSDSSKFKGTMKMLDLLEEKLMILQDKNLQRVSTDREEEMGAWLLQVKEAADDAEELVKDMESGESAIPDVMTWFRSDSSNLLRMKYTIGRLVSVFTEGESLLGMPNLDEDVLESMRNDSASSTPDHVYVVGRDKEIAMILDMVLEDARFKVVTSLESWASADTLQISQKGWIIETLQNINPSQQRHEDAEVSPYPKEMGGTIEYTQVCNNTVSELMNPMIIPMVGISGVGKTTLAQHIFNDKRIQKHFQGQSAWIYCTDNIRKEELMTKILVSLQPQHKILDVGFDLNSLHNQLQSFIEGKRFFIVLDDVSDDIRAVWGDVRSVLSRGAPGSVILVTTRLYGVASIMGTTAPIFLNPLQYDDLWKIFKHHAFFGNQSTEALESIGRKIAKKLHGLPLAAIMVAVSLRNCLDEVHWNILLKSWWWSVSNLPQSIRHLSINMHNMNVSWGDYNIKNLRSLMLFGGLCDSSSSECYTTVDSLLERSYGTVDRLSEISYDNVDSISEGCSDAIDNEHADISFKRSCVNIGSILRRSTSLRLLNLSNMMPNAATTCFDNHLLVEDHVAAFARFIARHHMLPHLTHLRYLDFSYSGITELPDTLCTLCNLQVLGLRSCRFTQLPGSMNSLISLRHLHADADTIALIHGIGGLTKLQDLQEFRVKAEDGHRITELRDMRYIEGSLCISDLQRVANQTEASQANLSRKEGIICLHLKWDINQCLRGKYNHFGRELSQYAKGQKELLHASSLQKNYMASDISGSVVNPSEVSTPDQAIDILQCLTPPRNLQKLKIFGYPGCSFPDWVQCLRYIQVIEISHCIELQVLPPIGQLEHLKKLKSYELPSIKDVNSDVYGSSNVVFQSLEELTFGSMVKWENWADAENRELFPNLQKLQINRCYNLRRLPFMALSIAIKELSLSGCGSYSGTVSSYLHRLTCLTHLKSLNLDNILCKLSTLRTLCLYKVHNISVLQEQWLEQIKSLQELEFHSCYLLRKLPSNLAALSSLKKLSLQSCSQIHSLPSKGLPWNLKELQMLGCSPMLEARCQKEDGEIWVKKKIQEQQKRTVLANEFWQGWQEYEEQLVQCAGEQQKNKGEWLMNEEEDWLKQHSAVEPVSNVDVWLKATGEDWPKIAHIPYIRVNGDIIQNLYL